MLAVRTDEYGRVAHLTADASDRLVVGGPAPGPIVPPLPPSTARSARWPAFLHEFLRAHPKCEGCGRKAATGHHVKPFHLFPALELEESNIAAVCVGCHWIICHAGDWQLYVPTARTDLAAHLKVVQLAEKNHHAGE